MDKRIGSVLIIVENNQFIDKVNLIISQHSEIILGRQGIPNRVSGFHIISLVLDCSTDELGAFTGKLGRVQGIKIKSMLMKESSGEQK